ncbi:MAG: hypothetical protein IAI49_02380, partial [Candidatus Eremiobacteraeota bacterium]|nr:hypothetical protein [Candidatus Eremiobacteraeota bacterium]
MLLSIVGCTNSDQRLAVALVTPAPDASAARAATLERIYVLAKNHDETGLLAVHLETASPSPAPLDPAAVLGLFTLDRKRYARDFVAAYPTTADALAFDYGRAFAAAGVEPSGALFPVHALGALARTGDDAAYRKLLSALPLTSGTLGDAYRSEVRHAIAKASPAASIDAFATLPLGAELGAVASVDWCRQPPAALLAYRPTPPPTPPAASESPSAAASPSSPASPASSSAT